MGGNSLNEIYDILNVLSFYYEKLYMFDYILLYDID